MGTTAFQHTDVEEQLTSATPGTARPVTGRDVACRAIDLVIAPILLVLLSPVLIAIAIAIKIDSPGPVMFRQRRLGRGMKPFTVQKFRTMKQGVSPDIHREFVIGLIAGE